VGPALQTGEEVPGGEGDPSRASGAAVELGAHRVQGPEGARPEGRATIEPLAPARHKVCFTASTELRDKLERLQALMRSSIPDGDLAKIIDVAVSKELERIEAKRFAKTTAPRKALAETDTAPSSRHIPAAVRRVVHERDGGRCTYEGQAWETLHQTPGPRIPSREAFWPRGSPQP